MCMCVGIYNTYERKKACMYVGMSVGMSERRRATIVGRKGTVGGEVVNNKW